MITDQCLEQQWHLSQSGHSSVYITRCKADKRVSSDFSHFSVFPHSSFFPPNTPENHMQLSSATSNTRLHTVSIVRVYHHIRDVLWAKLSFNIVSRVHCHFITSLIAVLLYSPSSTQTMSKSAQFKYSYNIRLVFLLKMLWHSQLPRYFAGTFFHKLSTLLHGFLLKVTQALQNR